MVLIFIGSIVILAITFFSAYIVFSIIGELVSKIFTGVIYDFLDVALPINWIVAVLAVIATAALAMHVMKDRGEQ